MIAEQIEKLLLALHVERVRISGNNVIGCCPVHGERRPSFGVSVTKEGHPCGCFSCGFGGRLPTLVSRVLECDRKEALQFIAKFGEYDEDGDPNMSSRLVSYAARFTEKSETEHVTETMYEGYAALNLRSRRYLLRRGVSWAVQREANIRRHDSRLVFPWYDGYRLVGVTTRSYVEANDPLRGMSMFGFKKHSYLYTAGKVVEKRPRAVIVEGEISCLRLKSLGIDFPVCISGTRITDEQCDRLCSLTDRAVLLLDADAMCDAEEGATPEIVRLSRRLSRKLVLLRPAVLDDKYSDPADAPAAAIARMLRDDNLSVIFACD